AVRGPCASFTGAARPVERPTEDGPWRPPTSRAVGVLRHSHTGSPGLVAPRSSPATPKGAALGGTGGLPTSAPADCRTLVGKPPVPPGWLGTGPFYLWVVGQKTPRAGFAVTGTGQQCG